MPRIEGIGLLWRMITPSGGVRKAAISAHSVPVGGMQNAITAERMGPVRLSPDHYEIMSDLAAKPRASRDLSQAIKHPHRGRQNLCDLPIDTLFSVLSIDVQRTYL